MLGLCIKALCESNFRLLAQANKSCLTNVPNWILYLIGKRFTNYLTEVRVGLSVLFSGTM